MVFTRRDLWMFYSYVSLLEGILKGMVIQTDLVIP